MFRPAAVDLSREAAASGLFRLQLSRNKGLSRGTAELIHQRAQLFPLTAQFLPFPAELILHPAQLGEHLLIVFRQRLPKLDAFRSGRLLEGLDQRFGKTIHRIPFRLRLRNNRHIRRQGWQRLGAFGDNQSVAFRLPAVVFLAAGFREGNMSYALRIFFGELLPLLLAGQERRGNMAFTALRDKLIPVPLPFLADKIPAGEGSILKHMLNTGACD